MPLCIRCSTSNPPHCSRCGQCGATLPRAAGEENQAAALFAVEDGRIYPQPTETFDSENLAQLRMALEDYLEGGEAQEVKVWLKHLRSGLEEFSTIGLEGLQRALDVERNLNPGGDFHHNVGYLMHKGLLLCGSGLSRLDQAMACGDDAALPAALDEFRLGNDHICTALLMMQERKDMLDAAIRNSSPASSQD